MSTVIRLPEKLYKRLEKYAEGFDTPVQVIEKILNKMEGITNEITYESENDNLLQIRLNPSNVSLFKEQLLKKRKAEIAIFYNDGREEIKPWNASRFTEDSDVIGNLRSRKELRQGAWQKLGIKYISVSI